MNTPQQGTKYSADGKQWFGTEAEAIEHSAAAQCPHKYVSRDGGGNWEWVYFATEEQAHDVIAWIREGGSSKFSAGRAHYNGHTPAGTHCVHAHYDNARRVPYQSASAVA